MAKPSSTTEPSRRTKLRKKSTSAGGTASSSLPPEAGAEVEVEVEGDAPLETRTVRVKLASLSPLENNARYMSPAQFDRLTTNLKRDGVLTSFPLVYKGVILSGNHRVKAALAAGIEEAEVIEVMTELTPSRSVALQLSHNAITGEDDANVLAGLYTQLDLGDKLYSGLDDSCLNLEGLNIGSLGVGGLAHQELTITFLPAQAEEFTEYVERIKGKKKALYLVSHIDEFNDFFDAIVRVKEELNIVNTGQALLTMARLADIQLDVLEQEEDEQEGSDG